MINLKEDIPVVFTAQSKMFFYCRDTICEYVLRENCVPVNPFKCFDYSVSDRVDRDLVRRANFNLIQKCDQLWVFGYHIANGVLVEIEYALDMGKQIQFFTISHQVGSIYQISDYRYKLLPENGSDKEYLSRLIERLEETK